MKVTERNGDKKHKDNPTLSQENTITNRFQCCCYDEAVRQKQGYVNKKNLQTTRQGVKSRTDFNVVKALIQPLVKGGGDSTTCKWTGTNQNLRPAFRQPV